MERLELAVRPLAAEELQSLGLRGCGEGERREVRLRPAAADLFQHALLALLFRGFGAGFLLLSLLEAPGGKHGLDALRALAGLRGMRLVHDQREAFSGEFADLLGDDGELL